MHDQRQKELILSENPINPSTKATENGTCLSTVPLSDGQKCSKCAITFKSY